MICYGKSRPAGLLTGTLIAMALLFTPAASAHTAHHRHATAHALLHRHHDVAVRHRVSMQTSHRIHRVMAMETREGSSPWRHERIYGRRQSSEKGMMQARYEGFRAYRRQQLFAESEREAPITARLNLEQVQIGRERDAEIAQWQSQYGSVANRS
jgi:hypothetical protein